LYALQHNNWTVRNALLQHMLTCYQHICYAQLNELDLPSICNAKCSCYIFDIQWSYNSKCIAHVILQLHNVGSYVQCNATVHILHIPCILMQMIILCYLFNTHLLCIVMQSSCCYLFSTQLYKLVVCKAMREEICYGLSFQCTEHSLYVYSSSHN